MACEDIVGPLQQQVELLPRAASVLQVRTRARCHARAPCAGGVLGARCAERAGAHRSK